MRHPNLWLSSGLSNPLRTRRRYPTRRMVCRRVIEKIVGSATLNPTTTNPLLMPDTAAIVGFVGFCRDMGATNKK